MAINLLNPAEMYYVGLDSGVYKTVLTGGLRWFPVNNGITYKGGFMHCVIPSNPNVVYVGTTRKTEQQIVVFT